MTVKQKHYAVRVGREGPKIYDNWKDTERAVKNFPYAQHKSFPTLQLAQKYLDHQILLNSTSEAQIIKRIRDHARGEEDEQQQPNKKKIATSLDDSKPTQLDTNHPPAASFTSVFPIQSSPINHKPFIHQAAPAPAPQQKTSKPDFSELSPEQARVFQTVMTGGSVFFTGSAGTGKSHLLKRMIQHLRNNTMKDVHVTASTGIAASLIKGTTLHSFAGLGLANEKETELYWKIIKNESVRKRWTSADVLIIDEVSMIDGNFFDKLNQLAKRVRDCVEPFGGIQLILTGDFFQLPPVSKPRPKSERLPYLFESESWDECVTQIIVLKHVFRQSDEAFVQLLNQVRMGEVSKRTIEIMSSLTKPVKYDDGILPTELYPRKDNVALANQVHLENLSSPAGFFYAEDVPTPHCRITVSELSRTLDKNTLAPSRLVLKVGAQVMLIKNLRDHKLVNGSIGIVTGFYGDARPEDDVSDALAQKGRPTTTLKPFNNNQNVEKVWPRVRFTSGQTVLLRPQEFDYENSQGQVLGSRLQVPLILAWALSIHKSQGQSLDRVKIDLARSFEAGQVYVALSRATSLHRLQVLGFAPPKVRTHQVVVNWAKKVLAES